MPARFRRQAASKRRTFAEVIQYEFNYDVSGLEVYVDEQSPIIMEDLINHGNLKSRISIMDNVKGSKEIKLKTSSPTLQGASSCGWTPTGGIVLTDKAISTVRVKIQEEYCNEDLNDTWAQIEQAAGANRQDEEPPDFADTMIDYYRMRAAELDEALMWNGDTLSGDPNLAFYDGFLKILKADPLINVLFSTETDITGTNAFDLFRDLAAKIPTVVKRHRDTIGLEIACGYESAQFVIDNIWDDKDFAAKVDSTEEDGSISFILPTTNIRVRSYPELDGTDEVWGLPYGYMFYGTDLIDDMDDFGFRFNFHDEKLRFGVKWRSGVQFVFGQFFTRLRLTPTS